MPITHLQYEIAAMLGGTLWGFAYGHFRGLRTGANRIMRSFVCAARESGLDSELDTLLRAVVTAHQKRQP